MKKIHNMFWYYIILTIIFATALNLPMCVKAAGVKEINVSLEKDYASVMFSMGFEDKGPYQATVISPDNEEHSSALSSDSETTMICVVQNAKKGAWKIHVERVQSEDNTQDIEQPVGKVSVKVEGSYDELLETGSEIKVATDIAGLKMYFKDETFCAEWTDTSCGDVNITVSDSKTMQKLDERTVNGQSYSLEVNENEHKEIIVTVVPSTSSGIEGAEKTYTFNTSNHPLADVTFEDLSITNNESTDIQLSLGSSYEITVFNNGKQVSSPGQTSQGDTILSVPLVSGQNEITVFVKDRENSYVRTFSKTLEEDLVPPILNLEEDYSAVRTQEQTIVFMGNVDTDCDKVLINDVPAKIEGDHTFRYEYQLKEGTNLVNIKALDLAGNETTYAANVEQYTPESKPFPIIPVITAVFIVLLILAVIYVKILRPRMGARNKKGEKQEKRTEKHGESKNKQHKHDDRLPEKEEHINPMSTLLTGLKAIKTGKGPRAKRSSEQDKKVKQKELLHDVIGAAIPLVAFIILFTFVIEMSCVPSASMEPTIMTGDTVFFNRIAYLLDDVQRGDIVAFWSDEFQDSFVKRVIGLPGDEISFKDGYIILNGKYVDESDYLETNVETNSRKNFTVPEDCVFVLGDNREDSKDSRYFENPYIPIKNIKGKYIGNIDFSVQYDIVLPISAKLMK